ncbi:MAG: T9SS type A sorting domain-containing protein, partial [Candidatus Krumholzibacteria bacterium]|nr:T9SS type A sorting domain-containing protein [Candidatus Krumholzibacteria bacterium]
PRQYILYQNYPNPFNPNTTIEYDLPRNSKVHLMIYNALGEKIVILVDKWQPAGHYKVDWNGTNQTGKHVASGVYFYQLHTEKFVQIKKMLFVK